MQSSTTVSSPLGTACVHAARHPVASKKSDKVTLGRGNVFPQVLHVAGFFPAVCPHSNTESGHEPLQPTAHTWWLGHKQQGPWDLHSKQKPDSRRVLMGLPRWQMLRKLEPWDWIPTWAKMAPNSVRLSNCPTERPTRPTDHPTDRLSDRPTLTTAVRLSVSLTVRPSVFPHVHSSVSSARPSRTHVPSDPPSVCCPSVHPSAQPTAPCPSVRPSERPSVRPSAQPTHHLISVRPPVRLPDRHARMSDRPSRTSVCPSDSRCVRPLVGPSVRPMDCPTTHPCDVQTVQASDRTTNHASDHPPARPSDRRPVCCPSAVRPSASPSRPPSVRPVSVRTSVHLSDRPTVRPSFHTTDQHSLLLSVFPCV